MGELSEPSRGKTCLRIGGGLSLFLFNRVVLEKVIGEWKSIITESNKYSKSVKYCLWKTYAHGWLFSLRGRCRILVRQPTSDSGARVEELQNVAAKTWLTICFEKNFMYAVDQSGPS